MKKIIILACTVIALVGCKQEQKAKEVFTQEALAQKVYGQNGEESTVGEVIAQYKGSKVVLDIWASWCRDCIASMPETAALQKQFPDVKFVFLSVDVKEENWRSGIEKHINPNGVKGDQYFFNTGWKRPKKDEGTENAFIQFAKLDWIPRYMVLDENGEILVYYAKSIKDVELIDALK